MHLNTN